MVETSYFELCFLLPVLLKNLDNCFFLSMLFICYYSMLYSEFKARIAGIWPPFIKVGINLLLSKNAPQLRPLPSPLSPRLPLNVQLTLSGRKVNISKVPNYMQLETCTSQKAFEAWYGNRVNYRKYTILRCFA